MDDTALRAALDRLRAGDRDAFEAIYRAFEVPVFTLILRITQDRALAEDVMQEVFVKLYQSPPGEEIRKPRAYLLQSARNLAIDSVRRRPREVSLSAWEPGEADCAGACGQRLDLERALAALSLEERQLVTLHLNGGLKFREMAALLGLPLGTALWKYQRALGKLRALLEDGGSV